MENLLLLILFLSPAIIHLKGETLVCQDGSFKPEDSLFCKCTDGLFYNAAEGKCQNICEFYGNSICGYYNSAECVINEVNMTEYSCLCPDGFYDAHDGFCVEKNCTESGVVCSESDQEECLIVVGEDKCICMEGFLRNEDGVCEEIDLCHQAFDYPCSQVCNSSGASYECSCFDGYVYDPNTGECDLDDQYDWCSCSDYSYMAACHEDSDGKEVCNPLPGYQFANESSSEVVDVNECIGEHYCPANSLCRNSRGSYICECVEGYTYNHESNECEAISCPDGKILIRDDCQDICKYEIQTCNSGSQCMVNENNIGICKCQLSCQLKDQASSPSSRIGIYFISFHTPYYDFESSSDTYRFVKSFEMLFGVGNAEFVPSSYVYVGVSAETGLNELEEQLLSMCYPLDAESFEPKCILPYGLIINRNSLSVSVKYKPCTEMESVTCQYLNGSRCINWTEDESMMPGTYRCECEENYRLVEGLYDFYCEDYNECAQEESPCPDGLVCVDGVGSPATCEDDNGQISTLEQEIASTNFRISSLEYDIMYYEEELDDEESATIILGSVLGAFLLLSLVSLGIIGVYIFILKYKR